MSEYLLENREIIEKMCIDKIACKNDAIIFAKLVLDGETLEQYNGHWGVVEKVEKCAKCGKTKYFYAYGHERIKDWRKNENDN